MSDFPDPTVKAAGDGKLGASWLQIWWPALLVFGLIALVAAMGFFRISLHGPGHGNARTLNVVNALAQSIESFESEYARLPDVNALDFETESPQAVQLITIVLGIEDSGAAMQNPRQIPFLNAPRAKAKNRLGFYFSRENEVVGIYDSWGNPLRVILRDPGQSATRVTRRGKHFTVSKPAVVLSRGPDGKWDTKDDLHSWSDGG